MIGVMSLLIFAGCSDLIEPAETSEYTLMEHAPPLVKDARSLMQRKGEFFLLNMYKRDKQEMVCEHHSEHKDCKHHDEHECCDHHSHHQCIHHQESHKNDEHRAKLEKEGRISSKNLKVKWNKYHIFYDRGQEVAVFPIEGRTLTALSLLTQNGRTKKAMNKVTSKLFVRREQDNTLTALIGTYIYDQNYARNYQRELDTLGYCFENSHYTGYFVTSRLDGLFLLGRNFKKGKEAFAFRLNTQPLLDEDESPIHLFLGLNTSTRKVRSLYTEQEDYSDFTCSVCGKTVDHCYCVTAIRCNVCKKDSKDCICKERCTICNYRKDQCNCCKTCNRPRNQCICNTPQPDNNTGSDNNSGNNDTGGGGGGYQDGGYGNNYGGGNGGGNNSTNPYLLNTPYKISQTAMMSGVHKAMEHVKNHYKFHIAACNIGVQTAFKSMLPNSPIPPGMSGRANDMVTAWDKNSRYWQKIDWDKAIKCANDGLFVVAGWHNRNGSGHVVVILPGTPLFHKVHNRNMPPVLDTGPKHRKEKGFYLNNGFGPDKFSSIQFYYFKN